MKRIIILFLIILCLSFNLIGSESVSGIGNVFHKGIYRVSDFGGSKNNLYSVQNISSKNFINITILDEHLIVIESVRLSPSSPKIDIVPVESNFKVIIIGDGEAYVSAKD